MSKKLTMSDNSQNGSLGHGYDPTWATQLEQSRAYEAVNQGGFSSDDEWEEEPIPAPTSGRYSTSPAGDGLSVEQQPIIIGFLLVAGIVVAMLLLRLGWMLLTGTWAFFFGT